LVHERELHLLWRAAWTLVAQIFAISMTHFKWQTLSL
jgi:hypothetical protein